MKSVYCIIMWNRRDLGANEMNHTTNLTKGRWWYA